jgi:prepilin peptidase CpaA
MLMQAARLESSAFAGSAWHLVAGGVFTILLIVACITDVRWRRVPNKLVLLLTILGLAFSAWSNPWLPGVARAATGLLVGFAIWIGFYLVGGMGAGDVKLFAAAATWLGPTGAWQASLVAALLGGVLSLGALIAQRRLREGSERVAIAISTMSAAPLGAVEAGVARKRYLPYGIALSGGALLVAWVPNILGMWRGL